GGRLSTTTVRCAHLYWTDDDRRHGLSNRRLARRFSQRAETAGEARGCKRADLSAHRGGPARGAGGGGQRGPSIPATATAGQPDQHHAGLASARSHPIVTPRIGCATCSTFARHATFPQVAVRHALS